MDNVLYAGLCMLIIILFVSISAMAIMAVIYTFVSLIKKIGE